MDKKGYYAIIPASVRYDVRLTPNAKLLYAEITALSNEKGYCWASNDYFAGLYDVSKTSISKWVSSLKECGYVTIQLQYREGTKHILNRYIRLVNDPIEEMLPTYVTKVQDPIEEKLIDNITINTTLNNTSNSGETSSPALSKRFVVPSLDEVVDYCNTVNAGIDPVGFWNFYESKGWMIGKNKMKSWRHAVGTWKSKQKAKQVNQVARKTDSIRGQSLHDELTDRSWAN